MYRYTKFGMASLTNVLVLVTLLFPSLEILVSCSLLSLTSLSFEIYPVHDKFLHSVSMTSEKAKRRTAIQINNSSIPALSSPDIGESSHFFRACRVAEGIS